MSILKVAIRKREKLHPGAQEVNDWATQQIDYGKWKRGHSKRWTNEARRQLKCQPPQAAPHVVHRLGKSPPVVTKATMGTSLEVATMANLPWSMVGSELLRWIWGIYMDLWDLYTMVHGYKMLQVVQNR
jgi:hypothetical protein